MFKPQKGMQRSKSIVEFQQLMRQDAQAALRSELDRLIDNAQPDDKDFFANEFNSFANLFERFLQERGPSIEWEKIRPPAEGMVSDKICLFEIINKFNARSKTTPTSAPRQNPPTLARSRNS